jgi:quercetin dioxygenase-like cupin family protein
MGGYLMPRIALVVLASASLLLSFHAGAQQAYTVKPVVEKKIKELPPGPLYWRIENFARLEQAQAAAGPVWNANNVRYEEAPALAAEVVGKVWLFTLGPKGGSTPGATQVTEIGPVPSITAPEYLLRINHTLGPKGGSTPGATHVTEIGPVPSITAPEYLLRINHSSGPPGAKTPVHTHPGPEAFYVVSGRLGQRTTHGVSYIESGGSLSGHPADTPMEVSNSGTTDLSTLVMFVVDATKPFSVPAKFE